MKNKIKISEKMKVPENYFQELERNILRETTEKENSNVHSLKSNKFWLAAASLAIISMLVYSLFIKTEIKTNLIADSSHIQSIHNEANSLATILLLDEYDDEIEEVYFENDYENIYEELADMLVLLDESSAEYY